MIELPRKCADIGEKLSAYHSEEESKNRQIFLTILRNIRFLTRQGLALRGSIEEESWVDRWVDGCGERILILTLTRADVGFELSLISPSEQIC